MRLAFVRPRYRNRLLASLPDGELEMLQRHLSHVALAPNQTLEEAQGWVKTVYFIEEGICSNVVTLRNGTSIESGMVGRDGFVGIQVVLGTASNHNRWFMSLPGSGYSIRAKDLVELISDDRSEELRLALTRYVQGLVIQMAQTSACNRMHDLQTRFCRWILMCHDRLEIDDLPITHEHLGMMLGARRSTVTETAGILEVAGLIRCSRGHLRMVDRRAVEKTACECYSVVHAEYVRLGLL